MKKSTEKVFNKASLINSEQHNIYKLFLHVNLYEKG